MSKEVKLPSGATLVITESPFDVAKNLFQAYLEEFGRLKLDPTVELELDPNFKKDFFCLMYTSKKLEACIWECMSRVTYNGLKVTKDTFEPTVARGDYISVCFEVALEHILPFMKSLYVSSNRLAAMIPKSQA